MTSNHHRQILAWSIATALGALAMAPVLAQDAPASTGTPTKASDKNTVTTLDKIVVHAQKRVEYLQDVPVTMAVFNQQQLQAAGVRDIKDLQILVPDLSVTSSDSSANTTARIRGIGTAGDNAGLEPAVGVVIDGVPRARTALGFGDLGPLSEIEVLKGPQGTLFGKNTPAGAISISSQAPSFKEEGYADFTLANYRGVGVDAYYTNALSHNVAFSLYAVDRQHDGFNKVFVNNGPRTDTRDFDENFHSVRGQLLIKPSDNVDIRLIADYTQHNENCCAAVTIFRDPGTAMLADIFAGGAGRGVDPVANPSRRLTYANDSSGQKITDEGASVEVNWTTPYLGNATLTSITSVRKYSLVSASDIDFSGAALAVHDFSPDNGERFNTFSQELRLGGSTDRVDWTVGVFLDNVRAQRSEAISYGPQYEGFLSTLLLSGIAGALPPGLINTANPQLFLSEISGRPYGSTYAGTASRDQFNQGSQSKAVFGNTTWHVTDAFAITAGARYTHEKKDTNFIYNTPNGGIGCLSAIGTNGIATALQARGVPAFVVPLLAPTIIGNSCLPWQNPLFSGNSHDSFTSNEWSGTLKAAYRFNEHFLGYLSGARGYNAGGYNLTRAQSGTGQVNGGSGIFPITNTVFPAEFVNSFELGGKTTWDDGNLLINAALFNTQFQNYQLNTFSGISFVVDTVPRLTSRGVESNFLWQTPLRGLLLQGAAAYTRVKYGSDALADPVLANLPGGIGSFAPKWTGSGGVSYQWPVGSSLQASVDVNAKYTASYSTNTLLDPRGEQGAYTLLDARVALGAVSKHWTVELWGKNLTNRTYFQATFGPALQGQRFAGFLAPPRTFGITLRAAL
ncbi:MAG: TonB-dependent receptor [Rhodanobacter sp.]